MVTSALNVMAAITSLIAAAAAIILLFISRRQVDVAQQARFDSLRPILHPEELDERPGSGLLGVYNVGSGVALDAIAKVCAWRVQHSAESGMYQLSARFDLPVRASGAGRAPLNEDKVPWPSDTTVGSAANKQAILWPVGDSDHTWRVSLTYHDIFGKKHTSIFDVRKNAQTERWEWRCQAIITNITQDLDEISPGLPQAGSSNFAPQVSPGPTY